MAQVLISDRARKQLKPLPVNVKKQVIKAVDRLADWPSVPQVKKLQGREGYRIRAGNIG